MERKNGKAGIMIAVLLMSMALMAVSTVKASGTIYIRADGSIDPSDAPISTVDNITYTLTGNILSDADGIVVERDSIVVDGAGYTVQGPGSTGYEQSKGMIISMRSNITIKNTKITSFQYGIHTYPSLVCSTLLDNTITENYVGIWCSISSNNTISGNNITNNWNEAGIVVYGSSNNTISGNYITNSSRGIFVIDSSSYNSISGNNITANRDIGIGLYVSSSYNSISGNNITNNGYNPPQEGYGIYLDSSSSNSIFHNNFTNNAHQAYSQNSVNVWDDGYPSGGNYWSDYNGVDLYRGPFQNETGSDGIGDFPYTIGANNQDNYPIMKPYPWAAHDVGITSVATSKNVVGQGYTASINVMMFNYGNDTETFNVTVYANTTFVALQTIALESGASTTLTFAWNTTGFAKGNYTISAYAWPVPGETDIIDNELIDGWVFVGLIGDINADGIVDIADIYLIALSYGAIIGTPQYKPDLDINYDGIIDVADIYIAALHYGETDP
jgi:parallel beta-helix repeat protein